MAVELYIEKQFVHKWPPIAAKQIRLQWERKRKKYNLRVSPASLAPINAMNLWSFVRDTIFWGISLHSNKLLQHAYLICRSGDTGGSCYTIVFCLQFERSNEYIACVQVKFHQMTSYLRTLLYRSK